jgi:hypothetical protein
VPPEAIGAANECGKTPLHFHLEAFYKKRKKFAPKSSNIYSVDDVSQPVMKKLKVETQLVEASNTGSKKIPCRFSCENKFETINQRKEHEKLCWLRLPYGSIWNGEYCGLEVTLLSYCSVMHHEEKCNSFPNLHIGK